MEWFSWLSKTGLDPSLVYEYGLAFAQNELEESDIPYFDHEFLQSMGISIAKHRLEILKLARKVKASNFPWPLSRIVIAIKQTKRLTSKYLGKWMHHQEPDLALVPTCNHSARWRNTMVKRSKRLVAGDKLVIRPPLLLTNGSPYKVLPSSLDDKNDGFWDPLMVEIEKGDQKRDGDNDEDECWSCGLEEIRWDAMFENLKPT